jgi:hypothetical protein
LEFFPLRLVFCVAQARFQLFYLLSHETVALTKILHELGLLGFVEHNRGREKKLGKIVLD